MKKVKEFIACGLNPNVAVLMAAIWYRLELGGTLLPQDWKFFEKHTTMEIK